MFSTIKYSCLAVEYASKRLKDDKDIALIAVRGNGMNLENVSPRLQDDKEITKEAMKSMGLALEYASNRMKNDPEIVLEACKNDPYAFIYAGNKIKEQFSTVEKFLNSQKEITNDNPWSKGTEDKSKTWADKVNSDKDNQWER